MAAFMAERDSISLRPEPLTKERFALYGDVIEASLENPDAMNEARFQRFDDLCDIDMGGGDVVISVARCRAPTTLPLRIDMVERHPRGSQAFIPMTAAPFLAIVAEGADAEPGRVHAFEVPAGTGINLHRNVWHGVLTPLHPPGLFAVIDRIGPGANLEEHWFTSPIRIEP